MAGCFVGVIGRNSAISVAYFLLSHLPNNLTILVIFIVSCFVSIAMETSVGTITLVTPIACEISSISNYDLSLCIATVISGAMFGDNLSFISDTTIATCNGQNCEMKDKFKENFFLAMPAAIITAIIISNPIAKELSKEYHILNTKTASILDTFSCIFQGIIPYGAQLLVATSTALSLGHTISAIDIIPKLYYPFCLCLMSLLFMGTFNNIVALRCKATKIKETTIQGTYIIDLLEVPLLYFFTKNQYTKNKCKS